MGVGLCGYLYICAEMRRSRRGFWAVTPARPILLQDPERL